MSTPGASLTIDVFVVPGSGTPPQWAFRITAPDGSPAAHMTGPRILVLETLERYVALFREESNPALALPGVP